MREIMKSKPKSILAMILSLMMAICFMPAMAFADEPEEGQTISWGNVPEGAAVTPIALDTKTTITIPAGDTGTGITTFAFTPAEDGAYFFRSYGSEAVEGGSISADGAFEVAYSNEEENDWTNFLLYFHAKAGQTVYLQARSEYEDTGITYDVEVKESPVAAIEYIPLNPVYQVGERTNGYDTGDYFEYNVKYFETGDQLKITYRDPDKGTVTYTFDYERDQFIGDDGSLINSWDYPCPETCSDQGVPGKSWTIGAYPDVPNNYYYAKYKGAVSEHFPVEMKKGIADELLAKVKYKRTYAYTTKRVVPTVAVTYNGTPLTKGTDYELLDVSSSPGVGDNFMTLHGLGEYGGEEWISWSVLPKGTSLGKLTGGKKCITVKWKKQDTKMKVNWSTKKKTISGYYIECSTDKKFRKNVKSKYVNGYKKTSVKFSGLKAKKKYYVRISTYMQWGDIGFSSPDSKVKSVKTK